MKCKNVVLLPPPPYDKNDIKNLKVILKRIYKINNIIFATRDIKEDIEYYNRIVPVKGSFWFYPNGDLFLGSEKFNNKIENVFVPRNRKHQIAVNEKKLDWLRIFFNLIEIDYKFFIGKNKNTNFFRDIVKFIYNENETIYYPYGFIYVDNSNRNFNEFGFRIHSTYYNLSKRGKDHILIAITGGSAAWGVLVNDGKDFSSILEYELNKEISDYFFTVLNFAIPSGCIINEIITYLIFIKKLKPDIVISFSGYNDLYFGRNSDKVLQSKYKINYATGLNFWAGKLKDKKLPDFNGWIFNSKNNVASIVNSYSFRIKQYRKIVENSGLKFIFALQPFLGSKLRYSNYEKKFFNNIYYQITIQSMKYLYCKVKKLIMDEVDIDFDNIFSTLNSKDTFFGDIVHFNNKGERFIATIFKNYIKDFIKNG